MATAGKITIAEVEEIVEVGELNPDEIHTPAVFVQHVILGEGYANGKNWWSVLKKFLIKQRFLVC